MMPIEQQSKSIRNKVHLSECWSRFTAMHLAWGTFEGLQISSQFVAESGLSGTVFNHSDAGIPLSGFLRCKTAIDCS